MASATREETVRYTLVLSSDEVKVLLDIFGVIGGDIHFSRRSLTDGMSSALRSSGAPSKFGVRAGDLSGNISFS